MVLDRMDVAMPVARDDDCALADIAGLEGLRSGKFDFEPGMAPGARRPLFPNW